MALPDSKQKRSPLISERKYTLADLIKPYAEKPHTFSSNSILVIGSQGTKKTLSLRTIPVEYTDDGEIHKMKILYINADMRERVLPAEWLNRVDVVELPYNPDFGAESIDKHFALVRGLKENAEKYDVIIYDSVTPLNETLWDNSGKLLATKEPLRKESKDVYVAWGEIDEFDLAYQGNEKKYGYVCTMFGRIIFGLKAECKLFICICHDKEPYFGADESKKRYTANVYGKLKEFLPGQFDEVYFTYKHAGDWVWLTKELGTRYARSCHNVATFIPQDYTIPINNRWDEFTEGWEEKQSGKEVKKDESVPRGKQDGQSDAGKSSSKVDG
jgi:hypothetical protein